MSKLTLQDVFRRLAPFLLPFLIVVAMATLFMGSSPYYQTNPWDDTNAMLTMGRSIQQGLIPFVDIVEQRGPFIYSLYAIAASISNTSFFGVFIIELINLLVIYYFATRIARVFTDNVHQQAWIGVLAPLTLLGSTAFRYGGSPEEFAFTSVMYMLVILTENHGRFSTITYRQFFFLGLNLGFIFWNKFSLVGTITILFLLCGFFLLFRRQWLHFLKVVGFSVLGFFTASLPFFIYYIAVGHFSDLFNIYLIQNLTSYHADNASLGEQIHQFLHLVKKQLLDYSWGVTFMVTSWALALLKGHRVTLEILLAGGSIAFVALQKVVFVYYPLVWMPFIAIALIRLASYAWVWISENTNWSFKYIVPALIVFGCFTVPFQQNSDLTRLVPFNKTVAADKKTTYTAQPKFGEIMQSRYDKPTLLTLNTIDVGFFLSSQSVPVTPYYHRMNMSYDQLPIMYDTFANAMNKQSVDYAVVRIRQVTPERPNNAMLKKAAVAAVNPVLRPSLSKNYHAVALSSNAPDRTYVLLERNSAK